MTAAFSNMVKNEYRNVRQILSNDIALEIINEMYNHVVSGNYGKISLKEFKDLAQQILPRAMQSPGQLERIFSIFTGYSIEENTDTVGGSHQAKLSYRKSA